VYFHVVFDYSAYVCLQYDSIQLIDPVTHIHLHVCVVVSIYMYICICAYELLCARRYVEDDEDVRKYFAAFHLHEKIPRVVIIDDFLELFNDW
jgi:hypothetical protein